jgi:aminoglycoside phosphotransferase (APT) family kinase protein
MEKFDFGAVKSIVVDSEGWVNPCIFVNREWVFRFNARDPHLPKYRREKIAFELLKNTAVPVPRKVILDESKEVCPFDVLITEFLNGENLEATWPTLDSKLRPQLAAKAGEILKQLNSVSLSFFGELSGVGPLPQTATWSEYLKAKLSFHLDEALRLGLLDSSKQLRILDVFQSFQSELSAYTESRLVHVDYHFGNLLHSDGRITGVVDFEWALAGDPLYDFCRWRQKEEVCLGSRKPFLSGYGRESFNSSDVSRMDCYQMIQNIEILIVASLHLSSDEAKLFREITLKHLHELARIRL